MTGRVWAPWDILPACLTGVGDALLSCLHQPTLPTTSSNTPYTPAQQQMAPGVKDVAPSLNQVTADHVIASGVRCECSCGCGGGTGKEGQPRLAIVLY
ncbi:hypothetical protein E2C01_003577 [Portunus trituberculatus]|uniref:Uncharacterized protein n=1 Tax=Portunus trituberculatus TaxID=210409 RepID=A0A5B7CMI9_PORTR|nr:hypothetical protein [Portunus trituberculatus]